MSIEKRIKLSIHQAIAALSVDIDLSDIVLEKTKDEAHGDYACNIALRLSKEFKKSPRSIAEDIISKIDSDLIEKIEIAGPGFINFFIKLSVFKKIISEVVKDGENYGKSEKNDENVNIEFVSANPTGRLHVGHARVAAVGDTLSRLYEFAGYNVTREFYVNDAGAQVNNLGLSLQSRYSELFGIKKEIPEDGYLGEDVIDIAKELKERYGDVLLDSNKYELDFFTQIGITRELEQIKTDLKDFGVDFDKYTRETDIRKSGNVEKFLERSKGYQYIHEGATFLKTTEFGDDKDRPVIKSNGDYTYFVPDAAYHADKFNRTNGKLIDILGGDHHGYVARIKAALSLQDIDPDCLSFCFVQMVRLVKDGEEIKMSKRQGNAIRLMELCNEVGIDAVRYFFVSRSPSTHLDFDLGVVAEQNSSNPLYYAQYAHARIAQLLATSKDIEIDYDGKHLNNVVEGRMLRTLESLNSVVLSSLKAFEVNKITNYIQLVASQVHSYYNDYRIIDRDNIQITGSRLGLLKSCKIVLKIALNLIGVSAPDKM